jgi:hypothetical protein
MPVAGCVERALALRVAAYWEFEILHNSGVIGLVSRRRPTTFNHFRTPAVDHGIPLN